MKTLILLFALTCQLVFAQGSITTTTTASAVSATALRISVASATNIYPPARPTAAGNIGSPQGNPATTFLLIDRELLRVTAVSGTNISVERGFGGTRGGVTHASGSTVYVGPGSYFPSVDPPAGSSCTATSLTVLPYLSYLTGTIWTCPTTAPGANTWVKSGTIDTYRFTDGAFWVAPSNCWFNPTTYTDTVILTVTGASATPVLQTTTNSATGTETLICSINVPTRLTSGKGVVITDITAFYGIQTTASTSMTVAMNTITYPAAAASETASTVTPVAISGTVTNNTVTSGLGTTTAGAFWSVKSTLATPLALNTDLKQILYNLGFVSTTSGVHVINTPGLLVHFNISPL